MKNRGRLLGWLGCTFALVLSASLSAAAVEQAKPALKIQNRYLRLELGADGRCRQFSDRATGTNYCAQPATTSFASVKKMGRVFPASSASLSGGKLTVSFGEANVTTTIKVTSKKSYFIFEVAEVRGAGVEELVFADFPLTLKTSADEPFAGCALALNVTTHINEIPGPSQHLRAACYARPGLIGAKTAILGCPQGELRNVMKEVVRAAKDLPQTDRGGPWALDAEINRGSYLIDYPGSISETNVDKWIATVRGVGAKQIDFHTGHTLRFGDLMPDPAIYPRGLASVKAVVDKLHAAGIAAGLHTYAFFVAKNSKWVTPIPDPRLGKDATFTLTSAMTETNTSVPVKETTKDMSTLTGFQVRNSVTVQIDDELITYSGINKEPPYAFTGCQRGACGTEAAKHEPGTKVCHLKECFGLFTPDGDSTLFEEVAARTAEVYNQCGFDMIYLDALDGADVLSRGQSGWKNYHTKFVYSLCKALKKPAIMEMSTFDHSLWFARSRVGAWDAPSKGYKRFIDQHFLANRKSREMFMPANLGWWCVFDWTPKDRIRTFPDDLEYMMCKAIAGDHSLSWLMGFEPENFGKSYNAQRLAALVKQYEELRLANYFPQSVKGKLAAPDSEFTLEKTAQGKWQFRPVRYDVHKVLRIDGNSNRWKVENKFSPQPLKVRIEALLSLASYQTNGEVVAAFDEPNEFGATQSSDGVSSLLQTVSTPVKAGSASGCFTAKSEKDNPLCAWAMAGKKFSQPVNLLKKGFGVWIHGDGKGEVLNFQWRAPEHLSVGVSEHYARIDFTGWRYFEFVEPESDRLMDYGWPYFYANPDKEFGGTEGIQHWNLAAGTSWVDYAKLDSLKLWFNHIAKGEKVTCYLSPIKVLPHVKTKLVNPAIELGGKTITFPTGLESGSYLEFRSMNDCKIYDVRGALVGEVKPLGDVPTLAAGENRLEFRCDAPAGNNPRARVTTMAQGELMGGVNPKHKLKAAKE